MEAVKWTEDPKEIQLSRHRGHNLVADGDKEIFKIPTGREEEGEEGRGEDVIDQSAMKGTLSHADLMERRVNRRNATSQSPFSSLKFCSEINLVEDLLSGKEWSQFLSIKQSPSPPLPLIQSDAEDATQPSLYVQSNPGPDVDLPPDVFECKHADTEEEPIYEYMDLSDTNITAESQTNVRRQEVRGLPKILVDREACEMSPRTKNVYDTVEFIPPLLPDRHIDFSAVKSQGPLDSSVQKYRIRLSKKRKHRAPRLRHRSREIFSHSSYSTSPQQLFPTSIFYNIPTSGGEEEQQVPTAQSGGSPRTLAKFMTALKDKTKSSTTKGGQGKELGIPLHRF
ncbi:uncharacterized protein LOC139914584 [Centroberyx gerrardi]|uniref:uncharacterized protein n=1 Tax=Centroberyx gerrardi TaxID=166262 RepID=UPI003AAADB93